MNSIIRYKEVDDIKLSNIFKKVEPPQRVEAKHCLREAEITVDGLTVMTDIPAHSTGLATFNKNGSVYVEFDDSYISQVGNKMVVPYRNRKELELHFNFLKD